MKHNIKLSKVRVFSFLLTQYNATANEWNYPVLANKLREVLLKFKSMLPSTGEGADDLVEVDDDCIYLLYTLLGIAQAKNCDSLARTIMYNISLFYKT